MNINVSDSITTSENLTPDLIIGIVVSDKTTPADLSTVIESPHLGINTSDSVQATESFKSALSFNGTSAYVSLLTNPTSVVDNWTIIGWINPSVLPQLGFIFYNGNDSGGWGLSIGDGTGHSGSTLQGLAGQIAWVGGGPTLAQGVWYHVALVRRSGTWYFYLNATETNSGSSANPNAPTSGKATIGAQLDGSNNPTRYFNGSTDQIKAYNRAYSAADITADYNSGKGTPGSPQDSGIVGSYPFAEGTGIVTYDTSGNFNTGTLLGSPLPAWIPSLAPTSGFIVNSQKFISVSDSVVTQDFNTFINESMASAPVTGTVKDVAVWNSGGWMQLTNFQGNASGEFEYTMGVPVRFDVSMDMFRNGSADAMYFYWGCSSTLTGEGQAAGGYQILFDEFNGQLKIYFNGTLLSTTSMSIVNNAWVNGVSIYVRNQDIYVWYNGSLIVHYTDIARTLGGNLLGWGAWTGGQTADHRVRNLLVSVSGNPQLSPYFLSVNDTSTVVEFWGPDHLNVSVNDTTTTSESVTPRVPLSLSSFDNISASDTLGSALGLLMGITSPFSAQGKQINQAGMLLSLTSLSTAPVIVRETNFIYVTDGSLADLLLEDGSSYVLLETGNRIILDGNPLLASESVTFTTGSLLISASDSATTSESVVLKETNLPNVNDSTITSENVTIRMTDLITASDTTATSEAVTLMNGELPSVNDTATTSENLTIRTDQNIAVSDAETVSDIALFTPGNFILAVDTTTTSESVSVLLSDAIAVSDSTTASDIVTAIYSPPQVADAVTTSETLAIQTDKNIAVFDTETVSELVLFTPGNFVTATESATASENITVAIDRTLSVNDTTTTLENIAITLHLQASVADLSSLTDIALFNQEIALTPIESVTTSETVSVFASESASVFESTTASENVVMDLIDAISEVETVSTSSASDVVEVITDVNISQSDTATISDAPHVVTSNFNISLFDTVSTTERVLTSGSRFISVFDKTKVKEDEEVITPVVLGFLRAGYTLATLSSLLSGDTDGG